MDQWDRFSDSAPRDIERLGFVDNVDVFQPTKSYTADGSGYEVTYPSSPDATISGAPEPPEEAIETDRGGITAEADLVVNVDEDTPVDFDAADDSGESLTRLEVDGVFGTYEVTDVEEQLDGWLRLICEEVDA